MSEKCDHDYVHIETLKRTESGGYQTLYIKVDRFFCRKCLQTKTVKESEYSRETPEWY